MTFASNDPTWWPYINLHIFYSYWTGSSSVRRYLGDPALTCILHFAVAASVVVVYDWGEQDVVLSLPLPFF
jgi:hypothetical protein